MRRVARAVSTLMLRRHACTAAFEPAASARAAERRAMLKAVEALQPGFGLPGPFHTDTQMYKVELESLFYHDWLFAGHDCEIPKPGDYFTLQVGMYPVVVVRGQDNVIRAFHNVCRHRGYKLCEGSGHARKLVCPYHQWSYDLDGRLTFARDVKPNFEYQKYGLVAANCQSTAGYIFVSVADQPPPFSPIAEMFEPFVKPFDLVNAKVAYESRIVEKGNWKIVWENNRECYHCRGSHGELSKTFPDSPTWVPGWDIATKNEKAKFEQLEASCKPLGLKTGYSVTDDHQFRVMRLPLTKNNRSMTLSGEPAVNKRFGSLPQTENVGDVLFYHYPNTWNHFTPDHALSFRMLPISPSETELVTKWLVPASAQEGVDYDLKTLTEVWLATNAQDLELVERQFAGVQSPAYIPGPYTPVQEDGVMRFIDWYTQAMKKRLSLAVDKHVE